MVDTEGTERRFVPPSDGADWPRLEPAEAGFSAHRLAEAVAFAEAHDSDFPRSMYHADGRYVGTAYVGESGPWSAVVGPVRPRGGPAGVILRHGRMVAEWGDTGRPDMTFSVAKSYLALLAGIAVADGLIADIDEPVGRTVTGPWFESPRNARITWRHLLQQTSEWEGTLWGKPDTVDRNRQVGIGFDNSRKGEHRELRPPGTHFEYNDVRVNLLALCLLHRLGRPLPEVLRERVMDPIGASGTWEWHGYETSWIDLGGRRVQSVSGGGHWGGGLFIGARDHARVGLLVARRGRWGERQVLPEPWIAEMTAPSACNEGYGCLWWLNRGERRYPSAPASSIFALGGGAHAIWIDPDHDIVTVVRWIARTRLDAFMGRVLAALAG